MGATTLTHVMTIDPYNTNIHGPVVDEVEGLIKVYKDGHVERSQLLPCVGPSLPLELGVACSDIYIDKLTNVWARLYVPVDTNSKLPLLVYFHGGGFCVGSASWSCYHEFLARLSASSRCMVMSVNYRLAPENPLPAAYEDGVNVIYWLKKRRSNSLWAKLCDLSRIFLVGDSAGGNIAHHVAARLATEADDLKPLRIVGTILIQPFFGGEARTESERAVENNTKSSILTLAASDAWWRLALPRGENREHPYCKPAKKMVVRTLVCVAEMDVLMDREMEMCDGNEEVIKRVVYKGVGHAFHILEGASFRDQPYGRELPQGLWTTGLCDCHQDGHICVQTAIMPCISFAQNTEIVNRGTIPCMDAGLTHLALGFVGCCWLYAFPNRSRLREHFALPEEPCGDFWVHLFCTSCAICQESRELKNRGADPSISWLSNVEKWSREKVTPPIVVPGMNR